MTKTAKCLRQANVELSASSAEVTTLLLPPVRHPAWVTPGGKPGHPPTTPSQLSGSFPSSLYPTTQSALAPPLLPLGLHHHLLISCFAEHCSQGCGSYAPANCTAHSLVQIIHSPVLHHSPPGPPTLSMILFPVRH